ncbi:MAG: hypothetical protein AB1938_02645 [Myxococcota bacterium]
MARPRRSPKKSAPRPRPARTDEASARRALHYKVVELSNVDEGALERVLNEWVPRGWVFDGVQFAMRESSKRPSMAFVFFTREGPPLTESLESGAAHEPAPEEHRFRAQADAEAHLRRIAKEPAAAPALDPWARLRALAGEEDQDEILRLIDPDKTFDGDGES